MCVFAHSGFTAAFVSPHSNKYQVSAEPSGIQTAEKLTKNIWQMLSLCRAVLLIHCQCCALIWTRSWFRQSVRH